MATYRAIVRMDVEITFEDDGETELVDQAVDEARDLAPSSVVNLEVIGQVEPA